MKDKYFPAKLTEAAQSVAEFWLCDAVRADPEEFRKAKRLAILSLAFLFWTTLFALIYVALGSVRCGALTLWTTLPILGGLALLKRGRSSHFCGNLITTSGWLTLTGVAMFNGGLSGPSLLWYSVLPVVAVLTSGLLAGLAWTGICVACLVGFAAAETLGVVFPQDLVSTNLATFRFAALLGLVACQFVMAAVRVMIEQRALTAMHKMKHELAAAHKQLVRLESSRGYTAEEWSTLKREHAALTRFVRFKYGQLDRDAEIADELADDLADDELAGYESYEDGFEDEVDEDLDDDVLDDESFDDDSIEDDLPADDDAAPTRAVRSEPDLATVALQAILRPRP